MARIGSSSRMASSGVAIVALTVTTGILLFWVLSNASPILLVAVAVLVASMSFMHREIGLLDLRCITIPGFFFFTFVAMIYLPALVVFSEQTGEPRFTFLWAVLSVMFTVPLGIVLVNRLLRFQKDEVKAFFESPFQEDRRTSARMAVGLGVLLSLALAVTVIYFREVATVPLLYLIQNIGDYEEAGWLREESFKLLGSSIPYVYYVLRSFIYPMLITASFGYVLLKRSAGWLLFFLVTLVSGAFYNSASLEKAPVAAIFLMLFLYYFFYRGGRVSAIQVGVGIVTVFLFPVLVLLAIWTSLGVDLLGVFKIIGKRLFYVPAWVLYYYFELFPDVIPFLHGRTIGKLSAVLGLDFFNTSIYVFQYIFPEGLPSGYANAAFIGNLYADFGMWGVVVGGVLVGVLVQWAQVYLVRQKKSVLVLVVYTFLVSSTWQLNNAPLPVVLLSYGTVFAIVLLWSMQLLDRILSRAEPLDWMASRRSSWDPQRARRSARRRGNV